MPLVKRYGVGFPFVKQSGSGMPFVKQSSVMRSIRIGVDMKK